MWPPLKNPGKYAGKEAFIGSVCNDDSRRAEFGEPPVMVNYFYHSEVKKSAKKNSSSPQGHLPGQDGGSSQNQIAQLS